MQPNTGSTPRVGLAGFVSGGADRPLPRLFGFGVSFDLDHLPVAFVDLDHTEVSRSLRTRLAADDLFDDLFAKAVVHHAASASGLPVPSRTVALSPDTAIESWAPIKAVGVDTEVLEWIASQMRGRRRSNHTLMRLVATIIGAATLPLAHIPNVFDIGL